VKFFLLIIKNIRRNLVRSLLTSLGTIVLVFVVTLVWAILSFLDAATAEKSQNFKGIVSERWRLPSQMPFAYAASLCEGAASKPGDIKPDDSMTWQFYGGTVDPDKRTRENSLFAIATEPRKLRTMMVELDSLPPEDAAGLDAAITKMEQNRQGIILGKDRLTSLNKRIGERMKLYGINYREIDLELDIVGTFPEGRYDNTAAINRDYLLAALDAFERQTGKPHQLADKTLNLVWLRVPNSESFGQVANQILTSPSYTNPAVKFETAASGMATFLEAYRDLIWGMRWLLAPAILITLSLVISNAISISVRERQTELAVLKVLGFRPWQILVLVLGEALLIGVGSGLLSAVATLVTINYGIGGIKFPIAFFGAFYIPTDAIMWGVIVGLVTALVGSIVPAWSAQKVKVSEVFAKVA
jgi:putative ABC transport system permease protein